MVNLLGDTLAFIGTSNILSSDIKIKDTIYTKDEPFFKIPTDKWIFCTQKNNKWIKL